MAVLALLVVSGKPAQSRSKKDTLHYGTSLIVNIPLPEPEVEQAVEEVAQNTIIRGTKEYNKDEYIGGAVAAVSTPVFSAWKQGGQVFYKVRARALNPWNFKDSADVGTLAVRYVVQPQGTTNTVLRVDAVFVEDFRHIPHPSNGSVENAEYKDIQDKLAAIELVKRETEDALEAKKRRAAKGNPGESGDRNPFSSSSSTSSSSSSTLARGDGDDDAKSEGEPDALGLPPSPPAPPSTSAVASSSSEPTRESGLPTAARYELKPGQSLEDHVAELRREVKRVVKKPGAPLQSAPFHTATSLKSLEPGTEVVILITTAYWYGVETQDGEHGWLLRDQLEQLP